MDPPDGGSSEPVWAKTPICGVDADLENCGVKFSHSEKKTCARPTKESIRFSLGGLLKSISKKMNWSAHLYKYFDFKVRDSLL